MRLKGFHGNSVPIWGTFAILGRFFEEGHRVILYETLWVEHFWIKLLSAFAHSFSLTNHKTVLPGTFQLDFFYAAKKFRWILPFLIWSKLKGTGLRDWLAFCWHAWEDVCNHTINSRGRFLTFQMLGYRRMFGQIILLLIAQFSWPLLPIGWGNLSILRRHILSLTIPIRAWDF